APALFPMPHVSDNTAHDRCLRIRSPASLLPERRTEGEIHPRPDLFAQPFEPLPRKPAPRLRVGPPAHLAEIRRDLLLERPDAGVESGIARGELRQRGDPLLDSEMPLKKPVERRARLRRRPAA